MDFHSTKHKNKKATHIHFPSDCFKSFTKNHNLPLYDSPHNFNGLLQFFEVPKNQGTLSWNASQQNPHTNQPKHTLWEEFLTTLETSKLLIIPHINHQNQPLDRISASLSTLCSKCSCTSIWDNDLKNKSWTTSLSLKAKTTLHICSTAHLFVAALRGFRRTHFT